MPAVTTRLLLLADTHVPRRARDLPDAVWKLVDDCDLVVHAGDWVDVALLDRLTERAARVLGCWGNNDSPALRERLPEFGQAEVEGVRIGVVHDTGPATGREARVDAAFDDVDLLVFGHSHIPWDTVTPAGLRLLNPGSPTDPRRQPRPTCMTVELTGSGARSAAVTLHELL